MILLAGCGDECKPSWTPTLNSESAAAGDRPFARLMIDRSGVLRAEVLGEPYVLLQGHDQERYTLLGILGAWLSMTREAQRDGAPDASTPWRDDIELAMDGALHVRRLREVLRPVAELGTRLPFRVLLLGPGTSLRPVHVVAISPGASKTGVCDSGGVLDPLDLALSAGDAEHVPFPSVEPSASQVADMLQSLVQATSYGDDLRDLVVGPRAQLSIAQLLGLVEHVRRAGVRDVRIVGCPGVEEDVTVSVPLAPR